MLMATNLRLRACLTMCLNFPQFEPQVAYKTLAYKKKKCTRREAGIDYAPCVYSLFMIALLFQLPYDGFQRRA